MSTEKKKKLTKQEMIDKLSQLSEKDLQTICGGSNSEPKTMTWPINPEHYHLNIYN